MVTLNEIANNAAWFSLDNSECKVPLLGDDLSHGLRDFLRQQYDHLIPLNPLRCNNI